MQYKKDLSLLNYDPYIAHRGFHNVSYPENTTGAFKLALSAKFSIEFDIQLTKDNKVVIFHDDDMERLTGVKGRICDHTYEELLKYRILGSQETIPLFEDILNLVNGEVSLIIELKSCKDTNEKLVDETIRLLKEYQGKFIVMSFDPFILKMFRKKAPSFIRGQLIGKFSKKDMPNPFVRFMVNNLWINIISKPDFIDTEKNYYTKRIKRLHKKMPVICWTIKNKNEQKEALKIFDNITFDTYDPR